MLPSSLKILSEINNFCARIGLDPLLVQGAGGNISWKEGDKLWVKASGAWLADAKLRNIFVPVNLKHLQIEIENQNFQVLPERVSASELRPSIETLLHALMPHKIVLHLHPVEALAYLVRKDAKRELDLLLQNSLSWEFIEYFKPGSELAKAVHDCLLRCPSVNVVFLANHGVVIGGETIGDVEQILSKTLSLLCVSSILYQNPLLDQYSSKLEIKGYSICDDSSLSNLAVNPRLLNMVKRSWALYPDHVVFLGPQAVIIERYASINNHLDESLKPAYIFVDGVGVYEKELSTRAQRAQLQCYYDVLIRQSDDKNLAILSHPQVSDLLNWDAEKYRQMTS